jgi:phenylacetate-CoA ligase
MGVLSEAPCSCGRGLPVLEEISGRSTDFIRATDGTMMHGLALIYVVRDLHGIKSFKIIQEGENVIKVLVVPDHSFTETVTKTLVAGFKRRLGADMHIEIDLTSHIVPERSGKYRYVVSLLTNSGQVSGDTER